MWVASSITYVSVIQKGTGLAVPILFKVAVDRLTEAAIAGAATDVVVVSLKAAAMALVASGVFKAVSGIAAELRSVARAFLYFLIFFFPFPHTL